MGFPAYRIEWLDATKCSETHNLEEARNHSPVKAVSVGLLIEDNKDYIVLSLTHFYEAVRPECIEEAFSFQWTIPKKHIVRMVKLDRGG